MKITRCLQWLLAVGVVLSWAAPAAAQGESNPRFQTVAIGAAGVSTCVQSSGSGAPNGSVVGSPCDLYLQTTGALWLKASGSATDTGWLNIGMGACALSSGALICTSATPVATTSPVAGNPSTFEATSAVAGSGAGSAAGGAVTIAAGNGAGLTSGDGAGGAVTITAGNAFGPTSPGAAGGAVSITAGNADGPLGAGFAAGGGVTLTGGVGLNGSAGGAVSLVGGNSVTTGGAINLTGGDSTVATGGVGGAINVTSGTEGSNSGTTGAVNIATANAHSTIGTSGAVVISTGSSSQSFAPGTITIETGAPGAIANGTGVAGAAVTIVASAGAGASGVLTNTGGPGGALVLDAGAGGAAAGGSSPYASTGGAGATATLAAGAGGNAPASGTGTNTGGAGGNLILQAGAPGTGSSANGNPGLIELVSNGVTWEWPTADGGVDYVLTTDGSGNLSFTAAGSGGIGTVTSVDMTVPTGLAVSGNPITTSGTLAVTWSGTIPASSLPNPSATTLGGVESLAAVSHKWINTISTAGVPAATQPAFSDLASTPTTFAGYGIADTFSNWLTAATATRSGSTAEVGTVSGALVSGNCLQSDASHNIVDSGTTNCGGGGGGTPGGSNTQVQYNNSSSFGGITGATTDGTTLTLVAPILGTPASATLTNATGLPISTGVSGLGSGVAPFLGTPSVANFTTAMGTTGSPGSTTYLRGDNSWSTAGGGTPGGSSGDVQCNVSSAFAACDTGVMTYASHILTVNTIKSNIASALALASLAPAGGTGGAAGNNLTLTASNATTGSGAGTNAGGSITITAGNAAGQTSGTAAGGNVTITAGNALQITSSLQVGGSASLIGGQGSGPGGSNGPANLTGGSGNSLPGGIANVTGGAGSGTASGGAVVIAGGAGASANGGGVTIEGGQGQGSGMSGNVLITTNAGNSNSGTTGGISITTGNGNATQQNGSMTEPAINLAVGSWTAQGSGNGVAGGQVNQVSGAGQESDVASGTGGAGGTFTLTTGAGGKQAGTGGTGGAGGLMTIAGGTGGVSNGASGTRTGGAGGNVLLQGGAGGTGSTTNGAPGVIQLASLFESTGTKPTISGCSAGTQTGGIMAGTYSSGTSGTCGVTLTWLTAAPTGFMCMAVDITTAADLVTFTGGTSTTATFTGTTVSGDVIRWSCIAY